MLVESRNQFIHLQKKNNTNVKKTIAKKSPTLPLNQTMNLTKLKKIIR